MEIRFKLGKGFYDDVGKGQHIYHWYIYRQGYQAKGGAKRYPRLVTHIAHILDNHFTTNQAKVSTQAPRSPGHYELRLYYEAKHDGVLVARKTFSVVGPDQPAPPDWGPPGTTAPSDLPGPDYPFPKGGEYLDPSDCNGPFELETKPEITELLFVRWEDGGYLPIKGALNFGDAFYLEGRLEAPARKNAYFAQLGPTGGDTEEVALFPDEQDPTTVRSKLLYFIWDSTEEDANGAAQ